MTEREYLYTLTTKNNAWVVLQNINQMVNHDDTTLVGDSSLTLNEFDLQYIYLSKMGDDRLTTLVKARAGTERNSWYFLIDNTRTNEGEISSKIWYHSTVFNLLAMLPVELCKYLELKPYEQLSAHLSKRDMLALKSVLPLDFVDATHEEQVALWKQFLEGKRDTEVLDLSGFYNLTPRVIIEAGVRPFNIKTIILHLNMELNNVNWLYYFPSLTTLSMWYLDINDAEIALINKYAPGLTIVEFHYCTNITGRCLLELGKLSKIDKIVLNNEQCRLQDNTFETVITDEEWKQLQCNSSLTTLFINSGNLTLDFIDLSLKSFKGLTNFIMHEQVLPKLEKHSRSGHTEHQISFHSSTDINAGFSRYANVKITDLVRNKVGPAFSESMLRKIKELDPTKADIVELFSN